MYVVKLSSGKVIGPFNSSDLKEALQNGRISGDDLVRRTDGGDFVPIRSVRGLKDLIRPTVNTKTPASTPSQSASDAAFSIPSTQQTSLQVLQQVLKSQARAYTQHQTGHH